MRVHVFAPVAGGPLTQYVAYLLPMLLQLIDEAHVESITVTLSRPHYESAFFREYLAPFASCVSFDVIDLPLGNRFVTAIAMSQALLSAIARVRSNYVISVYADYGAFILALRCCVPGLGSALKRIDSIGIVHHGLTGRAHGWRDQLRDGVHRMTRRLSPWSETFVVNPMLLAAIECQDSHTRRKHRLLPHPVEQTRTLDRSAARAALGIPQDGRYLAFVGRTDGRKAIPELLAAFRAADLAADDRLLIAGLLYEPHRAIVRSDFADLLRSGRVVLIDRHLSSDDVGLAFSAADVVAVTYYPMDDFSANLVAAVVAGRPILANDHGYCKRMIADFDLGWSCDVRNDALFAETIRRAMAGAASFTILQKTRRLIEFHRPENYTETVLCRLKRMLGLETADVRSWEWVSSLSRPILAPHAVARGSIHRFRD